MMIFPHKINNKKNAFYPIFYCFRLIKRDKQWNSPISTVFGLFYNFFVLKKIFPSQAGAWEGGVGAGKSLSQNCHSERSEESNFVYSQYFRFFATLRMTINISI